MKLSEPLKTHACTIDELGLTSKVDTFEEAQANVDGIFDELNAASAKADASVADAPATDSVADPAADPVADPAADAPVDVSADASADSAAADGGSRRLLQDAKKDIFFQPRDTSSRTSLKTYQKNLICLDDPISLLANSQHMKGQQLVFAFVASASCDAFCAKILLENKSIIMYTNQKTFSDHDFNNPWKQEAKFHWIPVGGREKQDNYFELQVGETKTRESAMRPFDDMLDRDDDEYTHFKVQQKSGLIGYRDLGASIYAAVTIERNMSLFKTSWTVENNIFEWLGTLGGILLLLWVVIFALEFMLTYKKFQNYMASELYHVPEELDAGDKLERQITNSMGKKGGSSSMTRKRMHIPRDFHNEIIDENEAILNRSKVATCCKFTRIFYCCAKRRRIERVFKKARVYNA